MLFSLAHTSKETGIQEGRQQFLQIRIITLKKTSTTSESSVNE
jgi:hypothetical protein